jgi:hypothetical protein
MFRRCYGELGMLWRLCRLLANADVVGTTFDFGCNGPQADYFALQRFRLLSGTLPTRQD